VDASTYLTAFRGHDTAVDLGTTNTLVYVRGRGIVLCEPSAVAVDARTRDIHAVGIEAKRMLDRTPDAISVIRPLKDGVIADLEATSEMLRHFIHKVHHNRWARPRVVVCVPGGVTGLEKRAVEEACVSAGARQAYLIEEAMAAAIGAELPVREATGSMVLDIGGGTSEVAVISLGGIVVSRSLRVGGDEFDEAIINHAKRKHKLLIGQHTAEEIKRDIGSAYPLSKELRTEIRARGSLSEPPKTVVLTSEEVRSALDMPVSQIIDAVKETLDRTPPELASDIIDRGIMLTGGGSLLRGLEERLRHEMQMPAQLAESPLTCVAVGSGSALGHLEETFSQRWVKSIPQLSAYRVSRNGREGLAATAKIRAAVASGAAASRISKAWRPAHDKQQLTRRSSIRLTAHPNGVPGRDVAAQRELPGDVTEVH
jgi:rod shape-determining protein MreB and related proteins